VQQGKASFRVAGRGTFIGLCSARTKRVMATPNIRCNQLHVVAVRDRIWTGAAVWRTEVHKHDSLEYVTKGVVPYPSLFPAFTFLCFFFFVIFVLFLLLYFLFAFSSLVLRVFFHSSIICVLSLVAFFNFSVYLFFSCRSIPAVVASFCSISFLLYFSHFLRSFNILLFVLHIFLSIFVSFIHFLLLSFTVDNFSLPVCYLLSLLIFLPIP
jgi:hypothetical protein